MKDNPQLLEQLQVIGAFIKHHIIIILVLFFASIAAYIMLLTASLSQAQPSPEAIAEQAEAVARPKVSPEIVKTIEGLEERNIQVQGIFENARENPFTE